MESIPINTSIPNNGKFEEGTSIDSQIYFENPDDVATRLGLNKEVREFLTLLGRATEPRSASSYIDIYGEGFKNRYQKYLKELKQIK